MKLASGDLQAPSAPRTPFLNPRPTQSPVSRIDTASPFGPPQGMKPAHKQKAIAARLQVAALPYRRPPQGTVAGVSPSSPGGRGTGDPTRCLPEGNTKPRRPRRDMG